MVQIFGQNLGSPFAIVNTDGRLLVSAEISGNIIIGSVSANVDNVYVQSGNNLHLGSAWSGIGSALISNPESIGSLAIQGISGTIGISGTVSFNPGSVYQLSSPGSIGIYGNSNISNYQISGPWNVIGSGNLIVGDYAGSVYPIKLIGGSQLLIIGSVYQNTTPWVISGTADIIGSVAIITSVLPVSGTLFQNMAGSFWQISGLQPMGFINSEIIRKSAGSPQTFWTFTNRSDNISLENLGSNIIYYNLNGSANPANSGTAVLRRAEFISYDIQIGSISIQSSGTSSTETQLINLNYSR